MVASNIEAKDVGSGYFVNKDRIFINKLKPTGMPGAHDAAFW